MTRSWMLLKDRSQLCIGAELSKRLRKSARPAQIAYVRIMTKHCGDPSGVEYRHHSDSERWAFVLPDASGDGMRIQFFDLFAQRTEHGGIDTARLQRLVALRSNFRKPGIERGRQFGESCGDLRHEVAVCRRELLHLGALARIEFVSGGRVASLDGIQRQTRLIEF